MWSERRVPVTVDGVRRPEPTATGSSVLPRCRRTESCSSLGNRKRTPGPMFYSHLQTMTGQLAVADAAGSSRFGRPQRREPGVSTP